MTYIPDLHDFDGEPHEEVAKPILSDARKKGIIREIEDLIQGEYDHLQENAGLHITEVAAGRAEEYLRKVLNGDEDAAKALFECRDNSRYKGAGYDEGEPWAKLIHGRVFETNSIRLRREIVEAHKDLLESERNKDLQSIIDGLTKQINELEGQLDMAQERLRGLY